MPETPQLSGSEVARLAGVDKALVTRKRQKGMSDAQIIKDGQERQRRLMAQGKLKPKALAAPPVERPVEVEPDVKPQPIESYTDAQARKERALADLRELELAEKNGELVNGTEHHRAVCEMITTAKSRLLMIADELCDRLATETNPVKCREMLREKIRQSLSELAAKPAV